MSFITFKDYAERNICDFRIVGNYFNNAERIHPLKQNKVYEIINNDIIKNLSKKIIIFGSTLNISHSLNSDLDIAIELVNSDYITDYMSKISKEIAKIESDYDLICMNKKIGDNLRKEILNKGVVVYEC